MDNYTLAVLRSQGGRVREVCYENNNYRIQVWNVEISRQEREGRGSTPGTSQSVRQGRGGGGRKGQYIQLVSSTMRCYDLSPAPVPAYLARGSIGPILISQICFRNLLLPRH